MTIDGMDDFTEVTAILSPGLMSSIDFRCSARAFSRMGMELMAATPLTPMLFLVLSHRMRKEGGPAEMKSAEPDSSASIMPAGPPMLDQLTLTVWPSFAACFSIKLCFCITTRGRNPKPPAPRGTRTSETSALAQSGSSAAPSSNPAISFFMLFAFLVFSRTGRCPERGLICLKHNSIAVMYGSIEWAIKTGSCQH